jgi:phosphoglycolate phosphatase-like HAD superfamily hydrolase
MLPEAVIFDMDGTLADVSGIRHLLNGPGRFDAFHRASIDCPPHQWVVDAANAEHAAGRAVLVVTARSARYRHVTAMWLAIHAVPSASMFMRADKDNRPDFEVKAEILAKIRQRYTPVAAWDDNPNVIRLWEQEGIPVTVVPGWPFEAAEVAR